MTHEPRYYTIQIPRLDGYKTFTIQGLIFVFAVINMIYPEFQPPSPETTKLFVGQFEAVILAAVAVVNTVLRFWTDRPAFNRKPAEQPGRAVYAPTEPESTASLLQPVMQPDLGYTPDGTLEVLHESDMTNINTSIADTDDMAEPPMELKNFLAKDPPRDTATK